MEEVQSLTEDLRLMIHFDPETLTGMQTAEALREVECFRCDRLILRRRVDDQQRIGLPRLLLGRAEFEQ